MKPVSGEKLPLQSISRSQSWRGVRSQEGQSRDCSLISLARLAETCRSTNLPPCGGFRWLVTSVLSLLAKGELDVRGGDWAEAWPGQAGARWSFAPSERADQQELRPPRELNVR